MVDYTLEEEKKRKRQQARWWLKDIETGEIEVLGYVFNSGYESAMRLDAARRLAIESGVTSVIFTDRDNEPYEFTLEEALQIVLVIGSSYQTAFMQKQTWMRDINQATTITELPDIG